MHTLTELRQMLDDRGLAPRKSLGQNFLIDHNLLTRLVEASGANAGDVVLEVGPGAGALTEALLRRGCVVVAVELDRGLADLAEERFAAEFGPAFTLIRGDCLDGKHALHPAALAALAERCAGRPFTLVANLPYQAATPLMLTLLERHTGPAADPPRCRGQFVTIQKEVADRLLAGPGEEAYGGLSVIAAALADVRRIATLPPECFWPRPTVTSAMVAITPRQPPLTADPTNLSALCRRLFGQRRKQIGAVLGRAGPPSGWPEGVTPEHRAESLPLDRLIALAEAFAAGEGGPGEGVERIP